VREGKRGKEERAMRKCGRDRMGGGEWKEQRTGQVEEMGREEGKEGGRELIEGAGERRQKRVRGVLEMNMGLEGGGKTEKGTEVVGKWFRERKERK